MREFKNTLLVFAIFSIALLNCNGQKHTSNNVNKNIDIESIYNQIIKDSILVTGWYYIIDTDNGFKRQLDKAEEFYFIDPKPILVKEEFDKVEIFETDFKGQYPDYTGLEIRISQKYVDLWAEATEKSIGNRLGLIIDNKLVNAPRVNARIDGGRTSLNRTVYSKEELEEFKKRIK